jgi:hypothetical protein
MLAAIVGIPFTFLRNQAFCEACGSWCKTSKAVARVQHFDEELVREHVERKDFEYLVRLGPAEEATPVHLRLDLQDCPRCPQTHLLTVNRVTVSYNNNARQESAKKVVDRLWLDAAQAEEIRALPQKLAAMAKATDAPEPPEKQENQPKSETDSQGRKEV